MASKRITNPMVLLAIVPLALFVSRFQWTCDDAFISFRYVQHLVRGAGLTFNPGEAPPVEGFTNLLWVLVLAPFEAAGIALPLAANLLSASCAVMLLVLLAVFLRARRVGRLSRGAALLFFSTFPPVVIWSTSGLETMPFALAIFGVFTALAMEEGRARVLPAVLFALSAALLRADGALWCGFAFLAALNSCARSQRAGVWRAVLISGVLLSLGVALHFAWRQHYFGQWLPNTARVKAGFSLARLERGWKYLASFVLAAPAVALIPLLLLSAWKRVRANARFACGALVFILLAAVYAVFVGGDFMAMGRFMVPAVGFFALALAGVTEALGARLAPLCTGSLLVTLGVLGCLDWLPVSDALRQRVHFRWNGPRARSEIEQWAFMGREVVNNRQLGRALALHTRTGESLVRGNIGALAYHCELVLLDINGLVIPEVAAAAGRRMRASPGHDRQVEASFFDDRHPDYQYAVILPSQLGPRTGLGARRSRMLQRGELALERWPLEARDGFEPGTELRLLRDMRHAAPRGE